MNRIPEFNTLYQIEGQAIKFHKLAPPLDHLYRTIKAQTQQLIHLQKEQK